MWIPKNEHDVVISVSNGSLEETVTFDAKKEIPAKNIETAKDVSAMANTAGGVLLYGLDEDSNGRPAVLSPITLEGQRERIEQIIRTSIDEVPYFNITAIPTQADPAQGYLAVVIPPSERAPHMVVVKGERRYYGRGETGNYVLSQTEIARLYERRRLVEADISPLLEQFIQQAPLKEHSAFAHLYVVAKPILQDDNLLSKALSPQQSHQDLLRNLIDLVSGSNVFTDQYSPDFAQPSGWTRRPEGFLGKLRYASENDTRPNAHTLYIQVNLDGSGNLFCGRAAERHSNESPKYFFSGIAAGNTTKFLALLGDLYERASYFGMIDIGAALTGLEGCVPYESRDRFYTLPRYEGSDYRKTKRTSAALLKGNPKQVAAELLMPLIAAISQGAENPFDSN